MALGCSQHALRWQCRPPRLVCPWQQHGPWTSSWPQVVAQTSGFCMVLGDNKGHGTWTLAVVRSQTQTWRLAAAQTRKSCGTRVGCHIILFLIVAVSSIFSTGSLHSAGTLRLLLSHCCTVHLFISGYPPGPPRTCWLPACLDHEWASISYLFESSISLAFHFWYTSG